VVVDTLEVVVLDLVLALLGLEGHRVEHVLGLNHVELLVLQLRVLEELHVQGDLIHVCVCLLLLHEGVLHLLAELQFRLKVFEHEFVVLLEHGHVVVHTVHIVDVIYIVDVIQVTRIVDVIYIVD